MFLGNAHIRPDFRRVEAFLAQSNLKSFTCLLFSGQSVRTKQLSGTNNKISNSNEALCLKYTSYCLFYNSLIILSFNVIRLTCSHRVGKKQGNLLFLAGTVLALEQARHLESSIVPLIVNRIVWDCFLI